MPGVPPTTPLHGIPRFAQGDAAQFSPQVNSVSDAIDATAPRLLTGTLAARPPAGTARRIYVVTSGAGIGSAFLDTGSVWQPINPDTLAVTTAMLVDDAVTAAKIGPDAGLVPVGAQLPYVGDVDVNDGNGEYMLCDGRLISQATYPTFFARVGHKYNGGVDPGGGMLRIPDKRGRASVGEDNMGTAQGAAARLPNSNRVHGQAGGEERHQLLSTESGMPAHGHNDTFAVASVQPWTTGWNAPIASSSWAPLSVSGSVGSRVADTPGSVSWSPGLHSHPLTGGVSAAAAASAAAAHNNLQPYEVDNWLVRVK